MSGDLQITREVTLAEIPRKDGKECLRLQFVQARTADGKEIAWHSLKVFWKDDQGTYRPGKQGVTIRGREMGPIRDALIQATSGGSAAAAREIARQPMPDEEYRRLHEQRGMR